MGEQKLDGRALWNGLRVCGAVKAPPMLLPVVMMQAGIGDAYIRLTSPVIESVFVAYNTMGISAVMRLNDEQEFEEAFRARFGRRVCWVSKVPTFLARVWAT